MTKIHTRMVKLFCRHTREVLTVPYTQNSSFGVVWILHIHMIDTTCHFTMNSRTRARSTAGTTEIIQDSLKGLKDQ